MVTACARVRRRFCGVSISGNPSVCFPVLRKHSKQGTSWQLNQARESQQKVRDEQGNEVLSELDKLYVVHVNTGKGKERWDAGGPILPRLSTALANYPHTIVELEGRDTAAAILDFAARENIDVLILGSRERSGAMTKMVPGVSTLGSTSDAVKARCKCPCLIIRPSSARNEKMRIRSMVNLGQLMEGANLALGSSLPQSVKASVLTATAGSEPRKVCIAFEHAEPGSNMTAWAAKHCLFPDDDIHLVHITNRSPLEKMQKSASFQKAMLKPKISETPAQQESCEDVGREELQGFEEPCRATLKGDAKSEVCEYLEAQHIDLLVMGFSATNRIKKAFTGGSLSSHMLHHAPCPIVVLPLKSMAWEEQDTLGSLPDLRHSISIGVDTLASSHTTDGTSPPTLHSLGPRVSLSRSLSSQLAQGKDQLRRSAEATSPSSRGADTFASSAPDPARAHSEGMILRSPRSSTGQERYPKLNLRTDPSHPVSPFQASATAPALSADYQEDAARHSKAQPPLPSLPGGEAFVLRQRLAEREAQISALQEEVRHLKFQIAALKGSSNPSSRVMLPAR